MPRKRSNKNAWMPDYTKIEGDWFVYYRQSTREYKRLCRANQPRSELLKSYEIFAHCQGANFNDCIDKYLSSPQFKALSKGTRSKYQFAIETSKNKELRFSFGPMDAEDIEPPDVRLFMDYWAEMPEKANTMHTVLSAIFVWSIERGYIRRNNPCAAVKKFKSSQGGRYVSDAEYFAFFDFLIRNEKYNIASAMALAFLCGSRLQDVLRIKKRKPFILNTQDCYCVEDGIIIYQLKSTRSQLKRWSNELKQAAELDRKLHSNYLVSNNAGKPYTTSGFKSLWQAWQKKAFEKGYIKDRFRFHDMKIKAASDMDSSEIAQNLGLTEAMARRYNHTPDAVDVVR